MSENKLNVVVPKDYNGTPIEVVFKIINNAVLHKKN